MKTFGAALVSALMLTACGTYSIDGTPAFKEGYYLGCMEGYENGGRSFQYVEPRDEIRYQKDQEYRDGWNQGYQRCFDRAISTTYGEGGNAF